MSNINKSDEDFLAESIGLLDGARTGLLFAAESGLSLASKEGLLGWPLLFLDALRGWSFWLDEAGAKSSSRSTLALAALPCLDSRS